MKSKEKKQEVKSCHGLIWHAEDLSHTILWTCLHSSSQLLTEELLHTHSTEKAKKGKKAAKENEKPKGH